MSFPRWWFQTCFIFTPNLGEDEPNLTCAYFFQMGWGKTHQPVWFNEFCPMSWESKVPSPMPPPPGNKALLRPNQGTMVVNNPLIRPYFLGETWHRGGGPLRFPWDLRNWPMKVTLGWCTKVPWLRWLDDDVGWRHGLELQGLSWFCFFNGLVHWDVYKTTVNWDVKQR